MGRWPAGRTKVRQRRLCSLKRGRLCGLLYGVLNGWSAEKCLQFGWASGVLAASSLNDYAEPADEKQVWDIYAGNARVQR